MRLLCLLAMVALPLAASAQPLAFNTAPGAVEPEVGASQLAPAVEPTALRVALVVQQAEGSSCGDGADCSGSDCSPSGGDCDTGDGGSACLGAGGCLVLGAGIAYGIYHLTKRRTPRPDSLAALNLSPSVRALANALAESAHVTMGTTASASADVVLTVREDITARPGVGTRGASRQLVVQASDRDGNPIALSTGSLPSASLSLPVDASLADRARALLNGLAVSGQ